MKKCNLLLAAIAATSLVSISAIAQTTPVKKCEPNTHHQHLDDTDDGGAGLMEHRHIKRDHLLREAGLDLTDAQKKILEDAHAAQEPAMHDLHEKMRTAHQALNKAGEANADDAALTKLSNDLAVLIAQQEVARLKMHRQLLAVLTPEQKQKLEAFKAEHKNAPRWRDKQHLN